MALAWGSQTYVMGVINLTPDSFSDGGRFNAPERALAQARRLVAQGVHLLDLGAQSTRPGAADIGASEERARLLPALQLILEARVAGELPRPLGAFLAGGLSAVLIVSMATPAAYQLWHATVVAVAAVGFAAAARMPQRSTRPAAAGAPVTDASRRL